METCDKTEDRLGVVRAEGVRVSDGGKVTGLDAGTGWRRVPMVGEGRPSADVQ